MRSWTLALLLIGFGGCATTTPTAQRFTGNPYCISDEGSRISGLVCGVNVEYSVARHGSATSLSGFGSRSVYVEVHEQGGERRITGSLGGSPSVGELDLTLSAGRLRGRAGVRDVDLVAAGDGYRGTYRVRNESGAAPMEIDGRGELMRLPAAELAALMPAMLNCEGPVGRPVMHGPVAIRFGGAPGYETRAANELR